MITIINYGAGNLFSVEKAFAALGAEVRVSSRSGTSGRGGVRRLHEAAKSIRTNSCNQRER